MGLSDLAKGIGNTEYAASFPNWYRETFPGIHAHCDCGRTFCIKVTFHDRKRIIIPRLCRAEEVPIFNGEIEDENTIVNIRYRCRFC